MSSLLPTQGSQAWPCRRYYAFGRLGIGKVNLILQHCCAELAYWWQVFH